MINMPVNYSALKPCMHYRERANKTKTLTMTNINLNWVLRREYVSFSSVFFYVFQC